MVVFSLVVFICVLHSPSDYSNISVSLYGFYCLCYENVFPMRSIQKYLMEPKLGFGLLLLVTNAHLFL